MIKARLVHLGMNCENQLRFEKFYEKYFGFKRVQTFDIGEGKEIFYMKNEDGFYFEVFPAIGERPQPYPENDGWTYPSVRHLAFQVDDVDAKLAEMGKDAVLTLGPLDFSGFIPGWKTVWLKDPEGNIIEISQGYKDPL